MKNNPVIDPDSFKEALQRKMRNILKNIDDLERTMEDFVDNLIDQKIINTDRLEDLIYVYSITTIQEEIESIGKDVDWLVAEAKKRITRRKNNGK